MLNLVLRSWLTHSLLLIELILLDLNNFILFILIKVLLVLLIIVRILIYRFIALILSYVLLIILRDIKKTLISLGWSYVLSHMLIILSLINLFSFFSFDISLDLSRCLLMIAIILENKVVVLDLFALRNRVILLLLGILLLLLLLCSSLLLTRLWVELLRVHLVGLEYRHTLRRIASMDHCCLGWSCTASAADVIVLERISHLLFLDVDYLSLIYLLLLLGIEMSSRPLEFKIGRHRRLRNLLELLYLLLLSLAILSKMLPWI